MDNEELNKAIDLIRNMDTFERGGRPCGWMPNYTTNIADAWTLVEEMVKDERVIDIHLWLAGTWHCSVYAHYDSWMNRLLEQSASSAPLVIAKCYYAWRTHDRTS